MFKPNLPTAIGFGFAAGFYVAALLSSSMVDDMIKDSANSKRLAKEQIQHLIATLGPHAPADVLEENIEFAKFQQLISDI